MSRRAEINDVVLKDAVERALQEDRASADVTTRSIFKEGDSLTGTIIARAPGILAGLPVVRAVFEHLQEDFSLEECLKDGDRLAPADSIVRCRGRAWALLSGERTALNFLQRLSGVATATARYVELVQGTDTGILDTRKTTPGLRVLEKYAVRVGGGQNHRFTLEEMALIKDNHIEAAGSVARAVERVRSGAPGKIIEVEVQSLEQLEQVLPLDVDRVMLDNFDLETVTRAVERIRSVPGRRPEIEISGGVTEQTVATLARAGADFISVGALTHSATALDMSMEIES